MNKPELVKSVAEKLEIGRARVEPVIEAIWETITETVASGEDVKIQGFGKFECKITKDRIGRNPKTGEEIPIPSRQIPKFTAGKEFKDAVSI